MQTKKKKGKSVCITINSCKECASRQTEQVFTSDSWEYAEQWYCESKKWKAKTAACGCRVITGYHEMFDADPEIPNWCPKRSK